MVSINDITRRTFQNPFDVVTRAGASGPGGYFKGKELRRLDTIGDMELQNLKRIERAKIEFAKNKKFWDALDANPPTVISDDDTNPIQDFTPNTSAMEAGGSQGGRPHGWETDQIIHDAGQFDVFDIGTGLPYQAVNPAQPLPPLTFTDVDTHTITDVQKSQSFQRSEKIQKDRIAQLPKLFGTISSDWMSNPDTELEEILVEANKLNLDPAAVMAVYAIESNFGKVKGKSSKNATGPLQVTPDTMKALFKWFNNTANQKQYNIDPSIIDYVKKIGRTGGYTKLGLLRLKYNEIVGVPKNLWGAAYQSNAENVRDRGTPLANWDGKITNSDYNKMYTNIYNAIQQPGAIHDVWTTNLTPWGGAATSGIISSGPIGSQANVPQTAHTYVPIPAAGTTGGQQAGGQAAQQAGLNTAGAQTPSGQTLNLPGLQKFGNLQGQVPIQTGVSGQTAQGPATGSLAGGPITDSQLKGPAPEKPTTKEETNKAITELYDFKTSKDKKGPSLAQWKKDPAGVGNEIALLQKQRIQMHELAQIARFSGNIEGAVQAVTAIHQLDEKLWYQQGMQGLRDLEYGDTLRASRVWSEYMTRGTDPNRIQIRIRRDGNYNVYDGGKLLHEGVSLNAVSQRARLVFDKAYRDRIEQGEIAARQQLQDHLFAKDLEENKQMLTMMREIATKRVEGANEAFIKRMEKEYDFRGISDIKSDGAGNLYFSQGGKLYHVNTETGTVTIDGQQMDLPPQAQEVPIAGVKGMWATAFGNN